MSARGRFLGAAALSVFCLCSATARAGSSADPVRGETFTDPAALFPMPSEWRRQPILHTPKNEYTDLVVAMDQDIYYTLLPYVQAFGKQSGLKVVVEESTCGVVAAMLSDKTLDVGGFCCSPGRDDRLPGLRYHTVGIVAKAFIVHPENPVDDLREEELRKLYRGAIYRWSELRAKDGRPGPERTIKALGRLHCQKRPGHWRQLLDNEKDFSPRLTAVGSIPEMIRSVATSKDAIGWEVLTMIERNKGLGAVKPLRVNGVPPTDSEALAHLRYPFYRTYTLSTWEGKPVENRAAQRLVDYLVKEFDRLEPNRYGFVSQRRLRQAGWRFHGDELVGEPEEPVRRR